MTNTVFVVGLGPGGPQFLTAQAQSALTQAEVLCGYTVYLDLVRPYFPEKEYYSTGMTQEIDRCRWALETARRGKAVALVCSGDAGVYGMASPLLELAEQFPEVAVEVVPGLTAALSCGAVLGAPLAHDFCVISLSDRLTPWAVIERRLAAAAMGDFCVALYNHLCSFSILLTYCCDTPSTSAREFCDLILNCRLTARSRSPFVIGRCVAAEPRNKG